MTANRASTARLLPLSKYRIWAPSSALGLAAVLLSGLVLGLLIAWSQRFLATRTDATVAVAIAAAVCFLALGIFLVSRLVTKDWFHPLAFPSAYIAGVLLLPLLFLLGTGNSIGAIQPTDVSLALLTVFLLTIGGFALGLQIPLFLLKRSGIRSNSEVTVPNYSSLLRLGRRILVLSILLRVFEFLSTGGVPYGSGALTYDLTSWSRVAASGLVLIATVFVTVANANLNHKIFMPPDAIAFAMFALMTLATGSRGELIAPAIFALWARHQFVRPLRFWSGFVVAFIIVFVFSVVTVYRSSQEIDLTNSSGLVERAFVSISTPTLITSSLIEDVPTYHAHRAGSTYWAALEGQIPGPLARSLFGAPDKTGSFVFREIIGFTNPNAGLGFSFPSESYLNFGNAGAFLMASLGGLLFGYAYRRQSPEPSRALHLLYPILVATLPLSLRSDALAQMKSVIYPMIALTIAFHLARGRSSLHAPLRRGPNEAHIES